MQSRTVCRSVYVHYFSCPYSVCVCVVCSWSIGQTHYCGNSIDCLGFKYLTLVCVWGGLRQCCLESLKYTHAHTHTLSDRPRQTLKLQIRVTCSYTCTLSLSVFPLPHPYLSLCLCLFHTQAASHCLPRESPLRQSLDAVSEIVMNTGHTPPVSTLSECRCQQVCEW